MSQKNRVVSNINDTADEIDLKRIFGTLLDNCWLIIGITSLFAVVAIFYSILATPIYRADALVQVERSTGSSILNDISEMLPTNQPLSAAEIELIQSRMVIGKTVTDLNLDTEITEKYFPIVGKGWSRLMGEKPGSIALSRLSFSVGADQKNFIIRIIDSDNFEVLLNESYVINGKVGVPVNQYGVSFLISGIEAKPGTEFEVEKLDYLLAINILRDRLSVADKGKDTGVLALSLVGDDPVEIKKILNSIINNYLEQNVDRKSAEAAKSLEFLNDQLPDIRTSLDSAEDKLNKFRQSNDSVDLSLEAKSVLDTMVAVESQLNELTFKEAEISKLYTKEHPAYKSLLEKRVTLEKEKSKLNTRIGGMPKTQQEILRLTRDVQAGQAIYMQLLNKQQELSINKASTVGNVRIIDSALTQPKPVEPKKTLVVIIVTLLGMMSATGYVFIRAMLHKGINSPDQLEEVGINVYASIPLSDWQKNKDQLLKNKNKGKRINKRSENLLSIGNPTDLAVESIRSLRTSLHFAMLEAKNNILMISGASPAIGKTFVCANLAVVIAQAGSRVLLVDADLRKGYTHELLGVDNKQGLSEVLVGKINFEDGIVNTEIAGFDFLPRGTVPPNPSELLMGKRLSEFLNWANERYDIVIVDTPPILAVTDAAIIGRSIGTALIVARYEETTVKEVDVSIRRFEQNGVAIKGAIMNAMLNKALGNYGYYQYSYESEK
ncbi:Tyrosine-protein kinase wzc [Serratia fonticola]|uniref:tyrosine-protein kinase Wzc n=1 Tax=Serratia fonticola TaxID=47917 RepID=UPI00217CB6A3|nr:tyrosine-protein kinase Wzc [Serratia fonticola]CAI0964657.1 Tyrosine-protein kinase wzc [Serratia fonticola]